MSLPGREIHHRVRAPQNGPAQLLDLLVDRRADGRISDVRVDLHQEIAADDHRLELGMVDVGRNDRAPARHFRAHELGVEPFAGRNELHLGRDDALARVVQLRDVVLAAKRCAEKRFGQLGTARRVRDVRPRYGLHVAARLDPFPAQRAAIRRARRAPAARWCRRPAARGSPPDNRISRTGTRRGPTWTLRELGCVSCAAIGISLRKGGTRRDRAPFAGVNRCRFQGFCLNRRCHQRDTPGGKSHYTALEDW